MVQNRGKERKGIMFVRDVSQQEGLPADSRTDDKELRGAEVGY